MIYFNKIKGNFFIAHIANLLISFDYGLSTSSGNACSTTMIEIMIHALASPRAVYGVTFFITQ